MARKIGIMQGRLSLPVGEAIQAFPLETWRNEFAAAQQASLNHIEWIFDREDLLNPISSASGIAEMQALGAQTGVKINSLCADYFMSELLLRDSPRQRSDRADKLAWLITQCGQLKIRHVVLPFVDRSKIETADDERHLSDLIRFLAPVLSRHNVEIHLETSLGPAPFAALLDKIGNPAVKVNYDTGNSASLGYDLLEEFAAYGPRIGSIHLKDRLKGGTTVPLGEGQVCFSDLVRGIEKIDYQGDFVLQVARGSAGNEIAWAQHNLLFIQSLFSSLN